VSEHIHRWKRLPILSLSVHYQCADCDETVTARWTSALPPNLDVLDAEFAKHHGGMFAEEMHPQPEPFTGYGR
jgi:hypothetical protein